MTQGSKSTYTPEKAEQFFKRLKGVEGNLRLAAKSLGINPHTVYTWRRDHPEFEKKFAEARAQKCSI